jgi:hypothetical protein
MIQFRDRTIENETIRVGKDDAYYFGPNLHLKNCELRLRTNARALTVNKAVIEACHINAVQKLSEFRWYYSMIKECRFTGKFSGCDFGHWPDDDPSTGGIDSCDFSNSMLDGCRFLDCDASTLRFPKWPCFTILDPVSNLEKMSAAPWPARAGIILETFPDFPSSTAAVSYAAPEIIKMLGSSLEELRAVLEQFDHVIL